MLVTESSEGLKSAMVIPSHKSLWHSTGLPIYLLFNTTENSYNYYTQLRIPHL